MNNRIGILGGTFDPIHNGHIALAKSAMEQCGLERVILIPTGTPPHKEDALVTSAVHRLNMTKLASYHIPFLSVSDIEVKREGHCYTVDTLQQLKEQMPDIEYYIIIGADNIGYIRNWKDAKRLLQGLPIICYNRQGFEMEPEGEILEREYGARLYYLIGDTMPISSTEIRRKIKQKEDVSPYLNRAVIDYIQKNDLYGE